MGIQYGNFQYIFFGIILSQLSMEQNSQYHSEGNVSQISNLGLSLYFNTSRKLSCKEWFSPSECYLQDYEVGIAYMFTLDKRGKDNLSSPHRLHIY